MCPLPNPIPTNKPNVEPKRPPRPINITPLCKLSPILANTVSVKWAADYGKGWVVGIWLVEKLSSEQLLERLTSKGKRQPEFTRELIKKKLTDDEDGIATTNLKVTVSCPLGESRRHGHCDRLHHLREDADVDALPPDHLRPPAVFRRLSLPDDEREEAHLDLPRLRQPRQVRRPYGRWLFPGLSSSILVSALCLLPLWLLLFCEFFLASS